MVKKIILNCEIMMTNPFHDAGVIINRTKFHVCASSSFGRVKMSRLADTQTGRIHFIMQIYCKTNCVYVRFGVNKIWINLKKEKYIKIY